MSYGKELHLDSMLEAECLDPQRDPPLAAPHILGLTGLDDLQVIANCN